MTDAELEAILRRGVPLAEREGADSEQLAETVATPPTDAQLATVLKPLLLSDGFQAPGGYRGSALGALRRAAIERAIELLEANDAEWVGPGMGSA